MSNLHAKRNIRLLYAFWFLRDFHLWIPVWIVFLTVDHDFSLTQVTIAEGCFLIGTMVLEVPTGAVADHWGRSRSLALGCAVLAVCLVLFAFTTSFAVLFTSFMLWSLASTLFSGADSALLYDTLKVAGREGEYERIAGRGSAFTWVGVGVATALGGVVASLTSIQVTIFTGIATCAAGGTVALLMWEPPISKSESSAGYWTGIAYAFRDAFRDSSLRSTILLTGSALAVMEGAHYLVQPYLLDRGIEVGLTFSLLQVPMILTGVLGALGAARLLARAGESASLLALPAAASLLYFALVFAPGLSGYVALPLLFAVGAAMLPLAQGFVNRRVDSERRATVLSMQGMVVSLMMAAVAPAFGYITDEWGLARAFAAGGAITVATIVVFGWPTWSSRREPGLALRPVGTTPADV